MGVRPFVVHVPDPVLGLIVLHSDPWFLGPHPVGPAAGERVVRLGRPQNAPVELGGDAKLVSTGSASHHLAGSGPMEG